MKTSLIFFCFLTTLAGAAPVEVPTSTPTPAPTENTRFRLSDLLPRGFQRNPRLNLSIVTEMSNDGRALPTPTKSNPAYYIVWDGGMLEEGDVSAGEKPPPREKLAHIMESSLIASGYQPASAKNKPTLIIHYRWGVFNHLSPMDPSEETNPVEDQAVLRNLVTRAAIVGGVKFSVDLLRAINGGTLDFFRLRDAQTDSLVNLATSDLYFVIATAYEYDAALKGQKKVLWSTKLSTDSQGLAMDDTLPTLVSNAGTYFGHETKGAVLFQPRLFGGRVDIGSAIVVPEPPVTPTPTPTPSP